MVRCGHWAVLAGTQEGMKGNGEGEKVGAGQEVGDEDFRWGECVDSPVCMALPSSEAHLECSLPPVSSAQGDKKGTEELGRSTPNCIEARALLGLHPSRVKEAVGPGHSPEVWSSRFHSPVVPLPHTSSITAL